MSIHPSPKDEVSGARSSPKVLNIIAQILEESVIGIQKYRHVVLAGNPQGESLLLYSETLLPITSSPKALRMTGSHI